MLLCGRLSAYGKPVRRYITFTVELAIYLNTVHYSIYSYTKTINSISVYGS